MKAVTITTLRKMKQAGEKITCLTAYDYSFASLMDRAGIDAIMVGDSLGMVMQGHESTLPVTLGEVAYHSRCVARGCARALLIADLPFMSYQAGPQQALESAGRLMKEGGAHVVKLEGGAPMVDTVRFLVERGIPVCAHLGLTPQSVHQLGGYRIQGRDEASARQILADAKALEQAGVFAIVLETVPVQLATFISQTVSIPTIGIGAGAGCDGQVQVINDILGSFADFVPKHAKQYAKLTDVIRQAVSEYYDEVKAGSFPTEKQSFFMDDGVLAALKK